MVVESLKIRPVTEPGIRPVHAIDGGGNSHVQPPNSTDLGVSAKHKAVSTAPYAAGRGSDKGCYGVCKAPGHPQKPCIQKPGDRNCSENPPKRYLIPDCVRAGNPSRIAPWAKCSVDSKYSSWFVGGGTPFAKGRPRKSTEGTWGTDYSGLLGHAKVWLKYTRLDRGQGGEGAYETDGEPEFIHKLHKKFHH